MCFIAIDNRKREDHCNLARSAPSQWLLSPCSPVPHRPHGAHLGVEKSVHITRNRPACMHAYLPHTRTQAAPQHQARPRASACTGSVCTVGAQAGESLHPVLVHAGARKAHNTKSMQPHNMCFGGVKSEFCDNQTTQPHSATSNSFIGVLLPDTRTRANTVIVVADDLGSAVVVNNLSKTAEDARVACDLRQSKRLQIKDLFLAQTIPRGVQRCLG